MLGVQINCQLTLVFPQCFDLDQLLVSLFLLFFIVVIFLISEEMEVRGILNNDNTDNAKWAYFNTHTIHHIPFILVPQSLAFISAV